MFLKVNQLRPVEPTEEKTINYVTRRLEVDGVASHDHLLTTLNYGCDLQLVNKQPIVGYVTDYKLMKVFLFNRNSPLFGPIAEIDLPESLLTQPPVVAQAPPSNKQIPTLFTNAN